MGYSRRHDNGEYDNFVTVIANNFDVIAGPLVGLVYPLYASIQAIESGSRTDDQQWLTYWVLYSLIAIFELSFASLLEWFPIWSYAKLFFTCWLVLPQFNGATYVYRNFIRPFYMNPHATTSTIWYIPKKNPFRRQDDVLSAAERYIDENGPEAFERMIRNRKADREAKARRKHNMDYEEGYNKMYQNKEGYNKMYQNKEGYNKMYQNKEGYNKYY